MATGLDSKQVVSFEELLMSQVVQQEAPYQVTRGERDIQQGGVFGDGEGDKYRDE
jgi:cell division protein FtsW (lipid II flippase)